MGQQRYYEWWLYFVTFNTVSRLPYFQYPFLCELFIEELVIAKKEKKFDLYAFCINYDHIHLIVWPDESIGNISQIIQFIKRHFSRNANILLWYADEDNKENAIDNKEKAADNGYCQLNKKISHWRNEFFSLKTTIPKFKWQKSFYDHIIRDYADFYTHYRYTMDNYFKHGLPDVWKYTGLHYPRIIDSLEV